MKRYDPIEYYDQGGEGLGHMQEECDGDWVCVEVAEALQTELEAANAKIDRLTSRGIEDMKYEIESRGRELEAAQDHIADLVGWLTKVRSECRKRQGYGLPAESTFLFDIASGCNDHLDKLRK